ncbi:putative ubiE/COQ5 methyltransferase [Pyrenochaeta sp. MPI-SDFR-AT-0127]|nr:putative ubiE/COQ5 methyltransferase [Pyrenochaeta sp. MPI-SDFR-AT-0127]
MDSTTIYENVRARYSATARAETSPSHAKVVAQAFGYSAEELASIPSDSNLGLSCGNPIALASLKEGETVVDLGCGAGFDVFLASNKVGEKGMAWGVDMNEDMLKKARLNASKTGTTNVSFVQSRITAIDIPTASADVIISNCVINLVPYDEKHLVFKEMHRLLKPGGRVAVSDILSKKPLPEDLKSNVALYVGCVAGASSKEDYEEWLKEAGFDNVLVVDAGSDLNVYMQDGANAGCCPGVEEPAEVEPAEVEPVKNQSCCGVQQNSDGGVAEDMKRDLSDLDVNEWAGSFKVFAFKK